MAATDNGARTSLASMLEDLLGTNLPIAIRAYDGSRLGPPEDEAPATIIVRSPDALRRIVTAPGELGFGRAYVAGDLDVEGDIFEALKLGDHIPGIKLSPKQWAAAREAHRDRGAQAASPSARRGAPAGPAPLEGARRRRDPPPLRRRGTSSTRWCSGRRMTYSCAVFEKPSDTLDAAQEQKYELICRKLDLQPGQRLLDVGLRLGRHGDARRPAPRGEGGRRDDLAVAGGEGDGARGRARASSDRVEIRLLDYRDVVDGRTTRSARSACSSTSGWRSSASTSTGCTRSCVPGGRILNHGISRPWSPGAIRGSVARSFIDRYVFPDGELHEVGTRRVARCSNTGLEVRHVESLREHYALTLRHWVANLEANWDEAVWIVGSGRARVWRLYMAASALNFERGPHPDPSGARREAGRGRLPHAAPSGLGRLTTDRFARAMAFAFFGSSWADSVRTSRRRGRVAGEHDARVRGRGAARLPLRRDRRARDGRRRAARLPRRRPRPGHRLLGRHREAAVGRGAAARGSAAASRSRCSRSCSARFRTFASTSTRSTTPRSQPLVDVIEKFDAVDRVCIGSFSGKRRRTRCARRWAPAVHVARAEGGAAARRRRHGGCPAGRFRQPCAQVPTHSGVGDDRQPALRRRGAPHEASRCTSGRSTTTDRDGAAARSRRRRDHDRPAGGAPSGARTTRPMGVLAEPVS